MTLQSTAWNKILFNPTRRMAVNNIVDIEFGITILFNTINNHEQRKHQSIFQAFF